MTIATKLAHIIFWSGGLSVLFHLTASLVTTNLHKHPHRLLIRDLCLLAAAACFFVFAGVGVVFLSFILPDLLGGK